MWQEVAAESDWRQPNSSHNAAPKWTSRDAARKLDEAVREIGQSATGIQRDVARLGGIDKVLSDRSFARNWAVDLRGKGIRVNAVIPGLIPTPGTESRETEKFQARLAEPRRNHQR